MRYELFPVDELSADGAIRMVEVGNAKIAIIRTPEGGVHAVADRCPHRGARFSDGGKIRKLVTGPTSGEYEVVAGEYVVQCPFHGFEFSVDDGACPADPSHTRVRCYDVSVEDGVVVLNK
jgi:nitrite reductase (NADH) small subunit